MDVHAPSALARAIEIVGSQDKLAAKLNVSQPLISYWLLRSRKGVTAEWCAAIERATDGQVTREQLRPDIFQEHGFWIR